MTVRNITRTDLLEILLDARSIILELAEELKLEKENIDPPEVYLGGRIAKKSFNGQEIWTISSVCYVKAIVKNIEVRLTKEGMKLPAQL